MTEHPDKMSAESYDPRPQAHPGLHVIALVELSKGLLSVSASIALALVGPAPIRAFIAAIGEYLHFDPHHSALGRLLARITPDTVMAAAIAIGVYATLRFTLFYGLWRARAWASWLGSLAATVYLPFCLFAVWRYPGWMSVAALTINIVIVWVLVRDLLKRRRAIARNTVSGD